MFSDIAKVQKKMEFQSVLKVYLMTKNGQNMAKIEKIKKMQIIDNKEDKFFYFPIISMPCTGSGYRKKSQVFVNQIFGSFVLRKVFPKCSRLSKRVRTKYVLVLIVCRKKLVIYISWRFMAGDIKGPLFFEN